MILRKNIKKIIKEEEMDDFDWINMEAPNPFMTDDPLVVVWLDESTTESELGQLYDMLTQVNTRMGDSRQQFIRSLLKYSKNGSAYIRFFINQYNVRRIGYGDNKLIFYENKYLDVRKDLEGKPYIQYKLNHIFNDRLNESEDLDWIINTNPSFKNKIIKFEPLITEDEYNVVLNTLLNSGEGLYCSQGGIETLEPFLAYKYLHHLVIGLNGRVVFGASDKRGDKRGMWFDLMSDAQRYVERSENFDEPEIIDGREYFNLKLDH